MNIKKFLIVVGTGLAIFWVVANPAGAATSVTNVGNDLYSVANNMTVFFQRLF